MPQALLPPMLHHRGFDRRSGARGPVAVAIVAIGDSLVSMSRTIWSSDTVGEGRGRRPFSICEPQKKKRPLESGLSLGRKRPKRAIHDDEASHILDSAQFTRTLWRVPLSVNSSSPSILFRAAHLSRWGIPQRNIVV